MLVITTLYNGMILSTLSISSHGFALGFPKRPYTNDDVFLTYKSMIILKFVNVGLPPNNPQPSSTHLVSTYLQWKCLLLIFLLFRIYIESGTLLDFCLTNNCSWTQVLQFTSARQLVNSEECKIELTKRILQYPLGLDSWIIFFFFFFFLWNSYRLLGCGVNTVYRNVG